MLDLEQTTEFFDAHYTRSAFRLETLPSYDVGSDGGDVARYLRGEPDPDPERKGPWLRELVEEAAAGKVRSRVRVFTSPPTDYLRYEFEWGYLPNAQAGEQIRVLDLAERERPAELVDEDFWLLDNEHVLRMVYDAAGRFEGTLLAADPEPYRAARDAAVSAADEFLSWWERHTQYRRANWAA